MVALKAGLAEVSEIMSVIRNIVDSYREPNLVFERFMSGEFEEKSALGFLAGGCFLAFISRWPPSARQSHINDQALDIILGAALFGWVFVAPLLFYTLAGFLTVLFALFGLRQIGLAVRLSLFWSFLASAPVLLLFGLSGGFFGKGFPTTIVGLIWVGVFIWFLFCGFRAMWRKKI